MEKSYLESVSEIMGEEKQDREDEHLFHVLHQEEAEGLMILRKAKCRAKEGLGVL